MGDTKWTKPQEHSFSVHGGSLLISAAAGSGKTAVLVERIMRLITDAQQPVDVDRLLVVTFTRAAAAEMRQRLSQALSEKMAADPYNTVYQRQQLLLPQASITTVDGFCSKLLRRYAARAGLPPRFRIAEESETALLSAQALDEVLEESYQQHEPGFLALADTLNGLKNDAGLRKRVLKAYTFMQAQPFPQRWLRQQTDAYTAVIPLEQTVWMQPLIQEVNFTLDAAIARTSRMCRYALEVGLEPYADTLAVDRNMLEDLQQRFNAGNFDEKQAALATFKFVTLSRVSTDDAVLEEAKALVKEVRGSIKDAVMALKEYFYGNEALVREELAALAPAVEALGDLVLRYTERYDALKRERKLLDYNDIEHACVRLLVDETTGERTALARELAEQFVEIMVDECQDTNAVQDTLFCALSKQEQNLFMVGDVKQSIYGFRQAMPEIFTKRRDSYTPYDAEVPTFPATITLGNNFRSRLEVTDAVNFLYRQLMGRALGGVDYDEREALVCSASYYPPAEGCETEWLLVDKALVGAQAPSTEIGEARLIAQRIRAQMETMQVTTKTGTRPLAYGDICILLRGRKHIPTYIKELTRLGIPVGAEGNGSLLATPEVSTVLSLLRCIDNPLREVELTAVMLSPLYGFSPDDCARLRVLQREQEGTLSLYAVLECVAKGEWDAPTVLRQLCRHFLTDLRRFRVLAAALSADRLVERLYREAGIVEVFSARAGGRQRVANLHRFDCVARSFEQDGFRGLSAFVRYLDRLQEQDEKLAAGSSLGGDSVRVMTMHGSKGLEFPVVYLARAGGQFSNDNATQKLLFHHHIGIGLCLHDEHTKAKDKTLPYYGVQQAIKQDEMAEELRVWYVAMTRAREKLCIVLSGSDMTAYLARLEKKLPTTKTLLPYHILHVQGPADWFLSAALRHPSFAKCRQGILPIASLEAEKPWTVTVCAPPSEAASPLEIAEEDSPADETLMAQLRARLAYGYPYASLRDVPAKLAASQLSHTQMYRDHIAQARPAFLQQEGLTAAQKGTALHIFMQFADYPSAAADSVAEATRLHTTGFLTAPQAASLPHDKLARFFTGGLYRRMAASTDCRREFHFTVTVPADDVAITPTGFADEQVVVQGIADCVFREGDALVLVDYKTDRVSSGAELVERYRSQLQFYRQALESIFDLPVKEALLYSFYLDAAIVVP